MSRRSDRRAAELARHQATLDAIAGLKERVELAEAQPERSPLTKEERQHLAAIWAEHVCPSCGGWHGGTCRRVAVFDINRQTGAEHVEYWEDGQWTPDPRTIWPEDVFENPAEQATMMERAQAEAQSKAAAQRLIANQQAQQTAAATRRQSPRDKLREITGGLEQP